MIEIMAFYLSFVFFYSAMAVKDALLTTIKVSQLNTRQRIIASFEVVAISLVSINAYYLGVRSISMSIYVFLAIITVFPMAYNAMYDWAIQQIGDKQTESIYSFSTLQKAILLGLSIASLALLIAMEGFIN